MSLESLSTELLVMVLQFVGADQFRARLDRLTVNKRWYHVAQIVLLEETKLSAKNLDRFPPDSARLCGLVKSNMVRLSISLARFQEGIDISSPDTPTLRPDITNRFQWARWLNHHLLIISAFTEECKRLRMIHFRTTAWDERQSDWLLRGNYLHFTPVNNLLALRVSHSLTDLFIDASGTWFTNSGSQDDHPHMCTTIAKHVPTLRRLDVYLTRICPKILTLDEYNGSVSLRRLVVRLSSQHPETLKLTYSRSCEEEYSSILELRRAVIHAAEELAHRAPFAQSVYVLFQVLPGAELQTFDCLTGKYTMLGKDIDGNSVEVIDDE